jgi:hypothetical protein
MRRPERAAAALLLIALCASLGLLANPSGSASASTSGADTIKADIRYGCSEGGWVEVTIKSRDDQLQVSSDEQQLFQVGLTSPGSAGPDGGPTQVVAGQASTVVRLAGSANNADSVFIKRVATGEVRTMSLPDCRTRSNPTNFGLNDPQLNVSPVSCISGSQARVQAQIYNPNDLLDPTQKLVAEIDYTVLLVRTSDNALMAPTRGELMRFYEPGHDSVAMAAPAASAAKYEVRVIGVDGSVVTSQELPVNCARATGSPTVKPPSTTPAPTPTPTPTPTATPTRTPTPSSPAGSSSAVSHTNPATSPAPSVSSGPVIQPTDNGPVTNPPGSTSISTTSQGPPATRSGSHSSSAVVTPTTPGNASPSSSSAPTGTLRHLIVGDPARNSPQHIFAWNRNIALVVLVDTAAIAALVGATVVSARRR